MYDRIIPHLSQVDKQEIDDLNDENKPHYQDEEPLEDEKTGSMGIDSNLPAAETEEMQEYIPPIVSKNARKDPSVSKISKSMKEKRFPCPICIGKKFTTKYSLQRHNKNFHKLKGPQQPINEGAAISEGLVEAPPKTVKRLREEDDNTLLNYPEDKTSRIDDSEPAFDQRGLKRKVIEKTLTPRKRSRDDEDEENTPLSRTSPNEDLVTDPDQRGVKRKVIGNTLKARKKFRWENFS